MASPLPEDPNGLSTKSVSSTTWAYFEAGGQEWIIIGCSNKTDTFSTGTLNFSTFLEKEYYKRLSWYNFPSSPGFWSWIINADDVNSSAIDAVYNDCINKGKDIIYNIYENSITQKDVFPNAAATSELEVNEVLCLLANNYSYTRFGSNNIYCSETLSSDLRTYINETIYPLVKDLPIVPQPLTTAGNWSTTEYLFPLASSARASTESFAVENYLDQTKRNIASGWWLRSAFNASSTINSYYVESDGQVRNSSRYIDNAINHSYGVRPAFVLKI